MSEEQKQPGYLAAQKVEIKYTYARFYRRVFANLTDFIIFAFVFVGLFIGIRAIVVHTPDYIAHENTLTSIRTESGMYHAASNGRMMDIVSYLDSEEAAYSGFAKMDIARETVKIFIAYIENKSGSEAAKQVQNDYDQYRLNPKFTYESATFFVKNAEGEIVHNPDCNANAATYFAKAYAPFIDEHCQGYLITLVPEYLDLIHYESAVLFAGELLPAYLLAPILTYYVPMLCFRRGRMTLGKAMYRIGVVDKNLLVPSWKRTLARFGIFYVAEMLLAPFTFAIPFLVSVSLMAFSKSHQGLPDYFLGLYEVDVTNDKIYFSREEILLTGAAESKEPVNFKPTYED
ncbi:MAG: RDD family protein [Bacteroidales bacterium]|nr:RDD family protein [Bacteroidales bacterium]